MSPSKNPEICAVCVLKLEVLRLAKRRFEALVRFVVSFAVERLAVERFAVLRLAVLRLVVERLAVVRFALALVVRLFALLRELRFVALVVLLAVVFVVVGISATPKKFGPFPAANLTPPLPADP